MPTRPTKGDHGHADHGSRGRGNQKATYGSTVSEDVGEKRMDAMAAADEEHARKQGESSQSGRGREQ